MCKNIVYVSSTSSLPYFLLLILIMKEYADTYNVSARAQIAGKVKEDAGK